MRHSHVVTTALHSWCWRSRIILMTLLQVSAASLVFSVISTMTQRLRSTISTIVDTPETFFQQIPFCHTSHCRSRPHREGESKRSLLARGNVNASRRSVIVEIVDLNVGSLCCMTEKTRKQQRPAAVSRMILDLQQCSAVNM